MTPTAKRRTRRPGDLFPLRAAYRTGRLRVSALHTLYYEEYGNPAGERGDLMTAYHRRLTSRDSKVRLRAARAWSVWEGATSTLLQDEAAMRSMGGGHFALAFARIESHYFANRGFFERDDQLLHG